MVVAGGGCGGWRWWVVAFVVVGVGGGVIFCGDGSSFVIPTKVMFGGCCVGVMTI